MPVKEHKQFTISEIAEELGISTQSVHHLRRELRIDPIGKASPSTKALAFNAQQFLMMKLAMEMKEASFTFPKIRQILRILETTDLKKSVIIVRGEEANKLYEASKDYTQTMLEVMGDESSKTFHTFKLDNIVVAVVS